MKNKYCVNVNVYFEIVRVRVRVRPYPTFPLTRFAAKGKKECKYASVLTGGV